MRRKRTVALHSADLAGYTSSLFTLYRLPAPLNLR